MTNTRMSAKNGFQEGLVLDLSPTNSSANSLSSALNATLITYNGNELSLQNDMGNARVETAFLPEGYVPVGTCEFGDIIYIVSYNPIINKSQIGCFPSPERNIDSKEIGASMQVLQASDFQYLDGQGKPTGKLKANSVKKILYGNRYMHSGDKYIIYSNNIDGAKQSLSDYGNNSYNHGTFPKFVKIHVVSIEDSGKIVYLDSSTKWYDNNYYIKYDSGLKMEEYNDDIDSHRDLVSSAYSVFNSKVSGKLALLIELEKINGFSCAWKADVNYNEPNNIDEYNIDFHFNWETEDKNININSVQLVESKWNNEVWYPWKWNNGKWEQSEDDINIGIPEKSEFSITRHYEPEDLNITYEQYINEYIYSVCEENSKSYIKRIEDIIDDDIISVKNIEGKYYFNCSSYEKNTDNKWYYYTYTSENKRKQLNGIDISDSNITDQFINNTFGAPIIKNLGVFEIPRFVKSGDHSKEQTKEGLVYKYKVVPAMPYGMLEEYAQEGYIDFNRIGKKDIKLTSWKYYNYSGTSTLTWGMDAYCEPNKGIEEVVFEFYDNQGLAAAYHNYGKDSYNGRFTEYITFNEANTNYKLNNKDRDGKDINHKGVEVTASKVEVEGENKYFIPKGSFYDGVFLEENKIVDSPVKYIQNDAGILYPNVVYFVRISVKYAKVNQLGEFSKNKNENENDYEWIDEYRWYWTNNLLNEYYSSILDYNTIKPILNFDVNAVYKLGDSFKSNKVLYNPNINNKVTEKPEEQLKANVEYAAGDIEMSVQAGLLNAYNTFNLYSGVDTEGNTQVNTLGNIIVNIGLGNDYVNNSEDKPKLIFTDQEQNITEGIYPINNLEKKPIISTTLANIINNEALYDTTRGEEINEVSDDGTTYCNNYNNYFNISFSNPDITSMEELEYIGYDQESKKLSEIYQTDLSNIEYTQDKHIDLKFNGIVFSKFMEQVKKQRDILTIVRPVLYNDSDLNRYQMYYKDGHFYLKSWALAFGRTEGDQYHEFNIYKSIQDSSNKYETTRFDLYKKVDNIDESETECKPFSTPNIQNNIPEEAKGIALMHLVRTDTSGDSFGNNYELIYGDDNEGGTFVRNIIRGNCFEKRWMSNTCDAWVFNSFNATDSKIATCMPFLTMTDTEGKVHVLNNMFPVKTSTSSLTQEIVTNDTVTVTRAVIENPDDMEPDENEPDTGGGGSNTNLPTEYEGSNKILPGTTVGDMVASVLMNLYMSTGSSQEVIFPKIINQVKLSKHSIIYTKDIVIQVKLGDIEARKLLLMSGIIFDDYLTQIKNELPFTINNECNENNINIEIEQITKNCPIQFSFDYIIPNYYENNSYNYVIYCSDGTTQYTNIGIPPNILHYRKIEDNKYLNNFIRVDSAFKYALCTKFKSTESGQYIMDYNNSEGYTSFITNDNTFYNAFSLLGEELRCSNSSDLVSDSMCYTIHGDGEAGQAGLRTVNKQEALVIDARFSKTQ